MLTTGLVFAGRGAVGKAAADVKVGVVNTLDFVRGSANKTAYTSFAILDAEGNLIQTVISVPNAKKIYDASKKASIGAGRSVKEYAFDVSTDAVVLTGNTANGIVKTSTDFLKNATAPIPGTKYVVVPLANGAKNISSSLIGIVTDTADVTLDVGGSLSNKALNLIEDVCDAAAKGSVQIGKGIYKGAKGALNGLLGIFGLEV